MTKVFISQPMRGKTEEEILRERGEPIQRSLHHADGGINNVNIINTAAPGSGCCREA